MGQIQDRVKETTTTTGTGDITLAGAPLQFQTFNTAYGTSVRFPYCITDANGTAWETGRGYLSAATTLVREFVDFSTNSNAAISLSTGTHTVFAPDTAMGENQMKGRAWALANAMGLP